MCSLLLLILFSLSVESTLSSSSEESAEYVLDLNESDFYDLLEKYKDEIIFARFYLPNCPACESFHDDWQRIGETLNGTCIVVDFNCDESYHTCYYIGVGSFPEFGVFHNNRLIAKYDDDDYSYRILVNFIKKNEYLDSEYREKARRPWDN